MKKIFTLLTTILLSLGSFAATEQAWYNDVTSITNNGQYYIYSVNGKGFVQAGQSTLKAVNQNTYDAAGLIFTITNQTEGYVFNGTTYLASSMDAGILFTGYSGPIAAKDNDGTKITWTWMNNSFWNIHGVYSYIGTRYGALYYKDGAYGTNTNAGLGGMKTQTDAEYQWWLITTAQYDRHWAIYFFDQEKEAAAGYAQYENLVPAAYYTALETAYDKTFDVTNTAHSAEVVNAAKSELENLYTNASAVADAYAAALTKIANLEAVEDKGEDFAQVTSDIAAAKTALEAAMSVTAVNAAVAGLKAIDPVTFNTTVFTAPASIAEAASTNAGRAIVYTAGNNKIINNGQAVYKGTTTLTATAEATEQYYKFVRTANVTVNAENTTAEESKTIVVGAAETWHGIDLSAYGVGAHTITFDTLNAHGGNHTITLHLTVTKQDVVVKPVELSFCEGSDAEFRGNYYSESGTYEVTATGAERDTLFQIHVTVLQPSLSTEDMTIQYGDPEVWNDYDLSTYTVGNHELSYETVNAAGCDSIVTLYLTVVKKDTFEAEQELTFCNGDSAEYRGVWYKEAGEYTIEVEGETQDTLITVNVIVFAVDNAVERMTVAAGDTVVLPEGEWLIGETVVSGKYPTSEADVPELVFIQNNKTEDGCDAHTELIVTVTSREGVEQVAVEEKAEKFVRDGKLFIRRGEAIFTATGERVE